MKFLISHSSDLLTAVLEAHGGLERFNQAKTIEATFNLSGLIFASKGYPGHRQLTVTVDTKSPRSFYTSFTDTPGETWHHTADKTWIELNGLVTQSRDNPRASFAGQTQESQWDDMHILYFCGYAIWNYITSPFLFAQPGFVTRELDEHTENGETWRVLEVTFPDNIPTHNKVQKFMFDDKFMLRRLDYQPDVLGGAPASQYMFDHQTVDGLVFPGLRRVVFNAPSGVFGAALVLVDFCKFVVT